MKHSESNRVKSGGTVDKLSPMESSNGECLHLRQLLSRQFFLSALRIFCSYSDYHNSKAQSTKCCRSANLTATKEHMRAHIKVSKNEKSLGVPTYHLENYVVHLYQSDYKTFSIILLNFRGHIRCLVYNKKQQKKKNCNMTSKSTNILKSIRTRRGRPR